MPTNLGKVDKKKALHAYKDKLLTEIYYYDKRIEEARNNINNKSLTLDDESSDSDSEFSLLIDTGPPIAQLKNQQAMLKTCLRATEELTNLEVLQSEVNILAQAPVLEGETPILEPGTWREVTAECCVDLVPFSITFYAHRGFDKFSPVTFRGLKLTPLKPPHEAELVKSVLPGLRRPSDAVEVVKSYAVAHRSRRTSLARLADKFGAVLYMEPMETGGYLLKCANLLEVSWTLQNKWSPIAPFHHRLKFDLEYMDESYIKTIAQAHRQISDPSVDTDERTLLLAKIISTVLEAKPLEPESSDQEKGEIENSPIKDGARLDKRRTTLDREPDVPHMKKKKDSEVMAPPKSLPKKIKPKKSPSETKISIQKPSKRSIQDELPTDNVKKPKVNDKNQENPPNQGNEITELVAKNPKSAASDRTSIRSVASEKNKENTAANIISDGKINVDTAKINDVNEEVTNKVQKPGSSKKVEKTKTTNKKPVNTEKSDENPGKRNLIEVANNVGPTKNANAKSVAPKSGTVKRKSMTNIKSNNEIQASAKTSRNSAPSADQRVANDKINKKIKEKNSKVVKNVNSTKKADAIEKQASDKATERNVIKIVKNVTNEKGDVIKKVVKKLANDKPKVGEKVVTNEQKSNLPKKNNNDKVETLENIKKGIVNKTKKPLNEQNIKTSKTMHQNNVKKDIKSLPKVSIFAAQTGKIKQSTGTIEKENTVQSKTTVKSSKIPQKKTGTPKSVIKKMTVRVSPRKTITKTKTPLAGKNLKKIVQKPVTGIPRVIVGVTKESNSKDDDSSVKRQFPPHNIKPRIKKFEKMSADMSFMLKLGPGLLTKPKPKVM